MTSYLAVEHRRAEPRGEGSRPMGLRPGLDPGPIPLRPRCARCGTVPRPGNARSRPSANGGSRSPDDPHRLRRVEQPSATGPARRRVRRRRVDHGRRGGGRSADRRPADRAIRLALRVLRDHPRCPAVFPAGSAGSPETRCRTGPEAELEGTSTWPGVRCWHWPCCCWSVRWKRSGPGFLFAIAAIVVGLAFVVRERRASDPVLDIRLFRRAAFAAGTAIIALHPGAVFDAVVDFLPAATTRRTGPGNRGNVAVVHRRDGAGGAARRSPVRRDRTPGGRRCGVDFDAAGGAFFAVSGGTAIAVSLVLMGIASASRPARPRRRRWLPRHGPRPEWRPAHCRRCATWGASSAVV